MKRVVIVESPAKAKTINRYLGNDYVVLASYGHIRDLPSKNGSVKPEDDFSMIWEMDDRSKKNMDEIAKALKKADELYLATDPDREGEAISWHVQQVLEDRGILESKPVRRIIFHEITKNAIVHAIQSPRDINTELVNAYLARRALDYLVGFTLSPVLWRKLPGSRSAGRVQSVALRIIVEREIEIENFKTQEYWSIVGDFLNGKNQAFSAKLSHFEGKKLDKFDISNQEQAESISQLIQKQTYQVSQIEKKQVKRHPAAPFITSTLQQEASRKLGFSAQKTMQLAQRLYEGVEIAGELTGLISYMRTDSVTISQDAIAEARTHIEQNYGASYLPKSPRAYKSKAKNAQEAHEAIRPTSLARVPQSVAAYLDNAQLRLYELIWKRTMASQMESALFDQVVVDVNSTDKQIQFRATGTTQVFDGFLKLYQEGVDDAADQEDDESRLPLLEKGDSTPLTKVKPNQHFTQPPPRFSEASLVKKLEELGIGRPSTYASIIHVLQERDYVRLDKKQFIPEERGRMVTSFLVNFFKRYIEYDFTAHMEEQLDEISHGHLLWKQVLGEFWQEFKATIDGTKELRITEVLDCLERDMQMHLFHSTEDSARECPTCHEGRISLKLSKFGAFLGCSRYPDCKYTKALSGDNDGTELQATDEPKVIGQDPQSGEEVTLRKGPYGHYLQWGEAQTKTDKPKRVAIPQGIDLETVDLALALSLKALPKPIGVHPETNDPISIGIGKFGPYIKYGSLFVSIPRKENMFELALDRALELIVEKQKKNALKPPVKAAAKAPAKASAKTPAKAKPAPKKK